jgi:hypothetical protein
MYKLNDEAREQRLAEWRGEDASAMADEIALLRLLIEEQSNLGNVGTVNALCATLQRCVSALEAARVRAKEYLPRTTVMLVARQLINLVAERFRVVPGHEEIMDGVIEEFGRIPLLLEDKHDG